MDLLELSLSDRRSRNRRFDFSLSLFLVLHRWIVRTNFPMSPVPHIVQEAPDDVKIAINNFSLSPEIPRAESGELFEIVHDLSEVGLHLRLVRSLSLDAFDHLVFAVQSVYKIGEKHTGPAVLRKVFFEFNKLGFVH